MRRCGRRHEATVPEPNPEGVVNGESCVIRGISRTRPQTLSSILIAQTNMVEGNVRQIVYLHGLVVTINFQVAERDSLTRTSAIEQENRRHIGASSSRNSDTCHRGSGELQRDGLSRRAALKR